MISEIVRSQFKFKVVKQLLENPLYIGQTKRQLDIRIKEHKRSIEFKTETTALAQHVAENNHGFDFDNIQVLEKETKTNKRLTLESLHIKKNIEKTVNKKKTVIILVTHTILS